MLVNRFVSADVFVIRLNAQELQKLNNKASDRQISNVDQIEQILTEGLFDDNVND